MSLFSVVQRLLDKAGTSFIEPRREDGHGSSALTPTFVDTGLTTQTDALTDAELRASPVPVATGLTQPTTPADTQPVSVAALPLPTGAATAANQLPDNHQVQVSNLPTAYQLPADQLLALLPQTDALTNAQLRAAPVVVDTGHTQPMTGTNSSVTASVTAVTLLASNGPRRGATVYNDSTSPLKLSLGSVVTASSFTLIVAGGGYYEVPFGYRGDITGLWSAAIGAARVTELT